jgi:two-component system response regulator HydG
MNQTTSAPIEGVDEPIRISALFGLRETTRRDEPAADAVSELHVHARCTRSGAALGHEEAPRAEPSRLSAWAAASGMIGTSAPMRRLAGIVERIAATDASVLIVGESGSGKELVARALHAASARAAAPFVAINCAALPEPLLESELFGHAEGAFTDARHARRGLFAQAQGGTLLLDELGEMSPAMQAKLLRVLEERRVRPVGSDEEIAIDVRIVAATNRDLERLVANRSFREDLYYRVNVVPLRVPALRERGEDVLLLAQHFLERAAGRSHRRARGLTAAAADRLSRYDWPGNVRELENCIERAVALASGELVGVDDLPERVRRPSRAPLPPACHPDRLPPMAEIERRYIERVLEAVGHNRTRAAEILGVDRKTLYRKLKGYAADQLPR